MKRAIELACVFCACGLGAAPGLRAQAVVIDPANIVQTSLTAARVLQQVEQLAEAYQKQIEQLSVAQQQRDAILGTRGLGALLNGAQERSARRSAPATLEEVLRTVGGGEVPATFSELRALYTRIQRELELAPVQKVYGPSAQSATGRAYDRAQRTTTANLALSEKAYQETTRRVETYERLADEIDRSPDLKASTDLVARLLVENGLATNEMIRLNSLLLAGQASSQAGELASRSTLAEITRAESPRTETAGPRVENRPSGFRGALR